MSRVLDNLLFFSVKFSYDVFYPIVFSSQLLHRTGYVTLRRYAISQHIAKSIACLVELLKSQSYTYPLQAVDSPEGFTPVSLIYASPDGSTSLYAPRDAIKVAPAFFAAAAAYEATCGDASAAKKAGEAAVQVYTWAARRSAAWDVLNATYEAQVAYLLTTLEEEK